MDMRKRRAAHGGLLRARLSALKEVLPLRRLAAAALGFVYGLAAPAEGMAPFGLAYVAAGGQPLYAAFGVAAAALLRADAAVYIACAAVLCVCRAVFRDTEGVRRGWLPPLCAGVALLAVKSVVALAGGVRACALLLCESLLCAAYTCLLAQARHPGAPYCLWGRVAAGGGALLALRPVLLFGTASPARAAALLGTLVISFAGGPAAGASAGVALGAAFDLSGGNGLFFAASWCFTGLLTGLCAYRRRFAASVCAVLANGVATLWLLDAPCAVPGLYECFLASGALCVLPARLLNEAEQAFARRPARFRPETGRMAALSRAVGALGTAMEGLWEEPPRDDPAQPLREASERVCVRCAARERCWNAEYVSTMDALTPLLPLLAERDALTVEDFPERFAGRCLHLRRFCGAVNEGRLTALRRKASAVRDAEALRAVRAQYVGLQEALHCAEEGAELHPALEGRVRQMARAYVPRASVAVWSRDGRMHVDVRLPGGGTALPDGEAFVRSLEGLLDRAFEPPRAVETGRGPALRLSQRERLRVTLTCLSRPRAGERVCGDATLHLRAPDGRAVVMLSDGMGAGERAAQGAQSALSLLAGFARAGCALAESAAAVLPALAARLPSRGFVTLDLLEISLFTGHAQWLKYGAAPSYLLRAGGVRAFSAAALPAGLERGGAPEPSALRLQAGDAVVLLSDGVTEGCDAERILRENSRLAPAALCAALLAEASADGARDDMTVLIAQISDNTE